VRDDRERLLDILEAIDRVDKYAVRGRDVFDRDELVQSWCLRHLQIIGEAARAITDELKAEHPEMAWSRIVGMRHVLVHDYFGIDLEIVWSAVSKDLPDLEEKVQRLLENLGQVAP
jgi:uncharacterized protein with HEPN domain